MPPSSVERDNEDVFEKPLILLFLFKIVSKEG